MKSALIIPCYNRPEYLSRCLATLREVDYPEDFTIIMINDASTDAEAVRLFNEFRIPNMGIVKITNGENKGIKANIKLGVEMAISLGCEIFINLDSDAIVKPSFVKKSLQFYSGEFLLTAFNCKTKNANGTERHEIIGEFDTFSYKKSVGGINFCFSIYAYRNYIEPALNSPGNWDHNACIAAMKAERPIICLIPSLVDHIGFNSSLNHTEEPDRAFDYDTKLVNLPNVTLFGLDTKNFAGLQRAAEISQRDIKFGDVVLLNNLPIHSKQEYSRFIMHDLFNYIKTDYVLVIQWDGYVLDATKWEDQFLEYDFIGATWSYKDGHNVGNGGFSLRSKKLLEATQKEKFTNYHPEDHHICRTYRTLLEGKYGIKFPPEELANRFAIEAYGAVLPLSARYSGQFGFHGPHVDFAGAGLKHIPNVAKPASQPTPLRGNTITLKHRI